MGTDCPSARFRPTAPGRWARPSGKSATLPPTSPYGTKRCASSATSARWCVRTRPFARRSTHRISLDGRPVTFKTVDFKAPAGDEFRGLKYTIQVAPEDCTGCMLCSVVCPAKDKANPKHKALDMHPQRPLRDQERANYAFFLDLPEANRSAVKADVKSVQFLEPLFEYSGACAGCGETPYLKLVTQLFGERALIANATGCSSIYGANLPTTPYTTNRDGRGPGWANSLFEDNAEFGLGMRLAVDSHRDQARALVRDARRPGRRRQRPGDVAARGRSVLRGWHQRPAGTRRRAAIAPRRRSNR